MSDPYRERQMREEMFRESCKGGRLFIGFVILFCGSLAAISFVTGINAPGILAIGKALWILFLGCVTALSFIHILGAGVG